MSDWYDLPHANEEGVITSDPSLLRSDLKIGDQVIFRGKGYLNGMIFKFVEDDKRDNGMIIVFNEQQQINL